tara:strand:- start:19110 stop:21653 length:2544 start_codon:yes stop_codon:yes gene_type:complete
MSIPTANVFISFTQEAMTQFLEGRQLASGDTIDPNIEEDESAAIRHLRGGLDVFSFSNANVDEGGALQILDFNHELGFKAGNIMKMSFLDPRREFENRVFQGQLTQELAAYGIDYKPDTDFPDPHHQQKIVYVGGIPENIRKAVAGKLKELKIARTDTNKRVYVMYGVGDNPDSWSGPHRMYIMNALIDAKASRIITLKLAASPKALEASHNLTTYGEPVKMPSQGKLAITGFSKRFANIAVDITDGGKGIVHRHNTHPSELLYGFKDSNTNLLTTIEATRGNIDNEVLNKFISKVDIHSVVVDCIRSFVQKTTGNPNVIALFPNLNFILAPLIHEAITKHGWTGGGSPLDVARKSMAVVDYICVSLGLQLQKFAREVKRQADAPGDVSRFSWYEPSKEFNDKGFVDFYATISTAEAEGNDTSYLDPQEKLKKIFYEINHWGQQYFSTNYSVITESSDPLISLWKGLGEGDFSEGATTKSTDGTRFVSKNPTFEALAWDSEGHNSAVLVGSMAMISGYLYGSKVVTAENVTTNTDKYAGDKEADLLIGFARHPLHPGDSLLSSEGVNASIREVVLAKHTTGITAEMFGATLKAPDVFAFSETPEGEKAQETMKKHGVPIFKYNTSNPNILKVKANYNPAFWAAVAMLSPLKHYRNWGAGRVVNATQSGITNTTDPHTLVARARAYMSSEGLGPDSLRTAISDGLKASNINPEIASSFVKEDIVTDILKIAEAQRLLNVDNPLNITIKVDDAPSKLDASVAIGSYINDVYRMVNQVTIKTLPFFSFSNGSYLFKECVMLSQFPNIRQIEELPYSNLDAFLSGVYRISGFKHTISGKTVDSQFRLVKNI